MIWIVMILTGLANFAVRFSMFSGLRRFASSVGTGRTSVSSAIDGAETAAPLKSP